MEGILVASDRNQEWLLPWWWDHYSKHNSYPVAFVDFGMSSNARQWCQTKGICVPLSAPPLQEVSSERKKQWETWAGSGIWSLRGAWFKKPFAFLQTPFPLTCWLDLDCEIRGSLAPLFHTLSLGADLALVKERGIDQENRRVLDLLFPDESIYNSGVVAFRKEAPILRHWVNIAAEENHLFMGDQDVLSRAIYLHRPLLIELPSKYNWKSTWEENPDAVIIHYLASAKLEILKLLHPELFPSS